MNPADAMQMIGDVFGPLAVSVSAAVFGGIVFVMILSVLVRLLRGALDE